MTYIPNSNPKTLNSLLKIPVFGYYSIFFMKIMEALKLHELGSIVPLQDTLATITGFSH
jgi:hypothetical protein